MAKVLPKLVLMTPAEFANKLIADSEGNSKVASNWFFSQMRGGHYLNDVSWLQAVAVMVFADIAAKTVI